METLSETRPKARKRHGCNVCLGVIAKGDTYVRQSNVDGGDLWTWKAHGLCNAAFGMAWDPSWHTYDDNPDWGDEIRPLVERFFANLAGVPEGSET